MTKDQDPHVIATASVSDTVAFEIRPDAMARATLATELGIRGVKKLSFVGQVAPLGARDLALGAELWAQRLSKIAS